MNQKQASSDQIERIDRITSAIATLEDQKKQIMAQGEVAPPGTVVSRASCTTAAKHLLVLQTSSTRANFSKN